MTKRRKKKDINIDLTAISLIISGIILAIIVYSSDLGGIGSFIKYGFLGGFVGKMTLFIPLLLMILRVICDI